MDNKAFSVLEEALEVVAAWEKANPIPPTTEQQIRAFLLHECGPAWHRAILTEHQAGINHAPWTAIRIVGNTIDVLLIYVFADGVICLSEPVDG